MKKFNSLLILCVLSFSSSIFSVYKTDDNQLFGKTVPARTYARGISARNQAIKKARPISRQPVLSTSSLPVTSELEPGLELSSTASSTPSSLPTLYGNASAFSTTKAINISLQLQCNKTYAPLNGIAIGQINNPNPISATQGFVGAPSSVCTVYLVPTSNEPLID